MAAATAESFQWQVTYQDADSFLGSIKLTGVQSISLLVGSIVAYLASLVLVAAFRENLQTLLQWRSAHNLGLALWSGFFWLSASAMMWNEGHFDSFQTAVCKPVEHKHFQLISLLFLLSKVWEWVDTWFLIIKNGTSSLRFLHVLHHMSTFWLFAVDNLFLSSIKYGVAVNGFIHTVMYWHYYRPFPRAYRKIITQLQIAQFLMSLSFHSAIWFYDCDPHVHSHFYEYISPYLFIGLYLVLFLNFYIKQYMGRLVGSSSGSRKTPKKDI